MPYNSTGCGDQADTLGEQSSILWYGTMLRSIIEWRIKWQNAHGYETDRDVADYLDIPQEDYDRWVCGTITEDELAALGYYDTGLHRYRRSHYKTQAPVAER